MSNKDTKGIGRTNGGKPHICGTIQVHNTRLDQMSYLCGKCGMSIDSHDDIEQGGMEGVILETSGGSLQWTEDWKKELEYITKYRLTNIYVNDVETLKNFFSKTLTTAVQKALEGQLKDMKEKMYFWSGTGVKMVEDYKKIINHNKEETK